MADHVMAGKGLTRWHIAKGEKRSICGSAIYTGLVRAACVALEYRCRNSACRGNWPDYRDASDNAIMRISPHSDRSADGG